MAAPRARIFHCDDNAGFRLLTRLTLADAGHDTVGEAETFDDCLSTMRVAEPDVVLMDGLAPDDDAWAALRRLLPDVQLVLYSGMPEPRLSEAATAVGADGCLSKDAPSGELAALVSRLLRR